MELTNTDKEWAKATISKMELFSECSESELNLLLDGLDKQIYKFGSTILFQGEISSRLYIVESGKVSVWVRKAKDKIKLAELSVGGFFGEISLLTPRAATATIKSEGEPEIISLAGDVVQALVKNNPKLANVLNKKIEERLNSCQQAFNN